MVYPGFNDKPTVQQQEVSLLLHSSSVTEPVTKSLLALKLTSECSPLAENSEVTRDAKTIKIC